MPIVEGGTNTSTLTTTDGVIYFDGTKLATTTAGTSGQVLTSNGPGVAPTYQASSAITTIDGDSGSVTGTTVTLSGADSGALFTGSGSTMNTSFDFLAMADSVDSTHGYLKIGDGVFLSAYPGIDPCGILIGLNAGNYGASAVVIAIGANSCSGIINAGADVIAIGTLALSHLPGSVSGNAVVAIGRDALGNSTLATNTVAIGDGVGATESSGLDTDNTYLGYFCAAQINGGVHNTFVGSKAGEGYTGTESSNIVIGSQVLGTPAESHTIRIGTDGSGTAQQNKCFIAGIKGITVSSAQMVTINSSTGQMGSATIPTGGIVTLNGDSGSATGTTVTLAGTANKITTSGTSATVTLTLPNLNFYHSTTNTFLGINAGASGTTGTSCTIMGNAALQNQTNGFANSAVGTSSLNILSSGHRNCCLGNNTLDQGNGSDNVAIGYTAGTNYVGTESSNILIGSAVGGTASENNTLRIGSGTGAGQGNLAQAFIQGIAGVTVSNTNMVTIDTSTGQMGSAAVPTPPANGCAFFAFKTSNQTITAATSSQVTWDTIVVNQGSVFAGNTFTVPTSGKLYYIHAHIDATSASITDDVQILVNGVPFATNSNAAVAATNTGVDVVIILPLTAGNTVTVNYVNNAVATSATVGGQAGPGANPFLTWFEGYQLN